MRARHSYDVRPCAKSVSQGVGPERGDQGAELLDLVLQLVATTSTIRGLAHQVQVVATFAERVRVLASLVAEYLTTRARAGRGCDIRIASES